jgi:hypothetical protein
MNPIQSKNHGCSTKKCGYVIGTLKIVCTEGQPQINRIFYRVLADEQRLRPPSIGAPRPHSRVLCARMAYLVDESGEEPVCSKSHDAPPPAHRGGANAARGGDGDITKSGAAAATHARTLTRRGSGEIDEGGCPHRASGVRGAAGGRRERKILKRFKCAPWRMIPWSSCQCLFHITVIK